MTTATTSTETATANPQDGRRPRRLLLGATLLSVALAIVWLAARPAETAPRPIMAADMPLAERLAAEERTLIVFHADWCPPCHELMPTLARLAERHPELPIRSVDVDAQVAAARRHGIDFLPTLVEFRHGQEQRRLMGARSLTYLETWIATP